MKGVRVPWSDEDAAIVQSFAVKYPKGKSINIPQVKANEPDAWQKLLDNGHTELSIRDKAGYIRRFVLKDAPTRKSDYDKYGSRDGSGSLKCKLCGEGGFENPQALGSHMRYEHPGGKKAKVVAVQRTPQVTPQSQPRLERMVNFCPECGCSLRVYNAAANMNHERP